MKKFKWIPLASLVFLLASCASSKQWTYLRDMEYGPEFAAKDAPEIRLQPGDEVSIKVFSSNPELAAPFNAGMGTSTIEGASAPTAISYLVDSKGMIEFPVLGLIKIEGKTLREVKDMISTRIVEMGYIKEPIVDVSMSNFYITVLKESGGNLLQAGNGPINLLQVVAQSGAGGQDSKIKDVMVIRTEDGIRKAYTVNLQEKALFDSPVFYLQQNDIVYFKPQGSRQSRSISAFTSVLSPVLSLGTLVSTYFLWKRLFDRDN